MTSPLEQCRDALATILAGSKYSVSNDDWDVIAMPNREALTKARAALAAAEAALQQESATFSAATILPDGSAFATASWPLPKDHWLYAPRGEWDSVRDEYSECPAPILNNSHAQAVRAAVKYAVRGATMCGQDMDFDPDAMVQNSVYALCGPANAAVLPVDAQGEPVAWAQLGMRNGHTYVRMNYEGHLYPPTADVQRNLNLVPLYAAPVAAPVAQPPEPDMRHPKIQALIGSRARREIELSIAEALLDDPAHEISGTDGDYWLPMHDKIVALQSAAPVAQGWQPIETAPKDGTEVLLCAPGRLTYGAWAEPSPTPQLKYQDGFAPEEEWEEDFDPYWASWDGDFTETDPPKHWMPLPAAPKKSA